MCALNLQNPGLNLAPGWTISHPSKQQWLCNLQDFLQKIFHWIWAAQIPPCRGQLGAAQAVFGGKAALWYVVISASYCHQTPPGSDFQPSQQVLLPTSPVLCTSSLEQRLDKVKQIKLCYNLIVFMKGFQLIINLLNYIKYIYIFNIYLYIIYYLYYISYMVYKLYIKICVLYKFIKLLIIINRDVNLLIIY